MINENLQRLRLLAKSIANRNFDLLDRLQIEHIRIRALFFQLRAIKNPKRRRRLFERIKRELELVARAEEEVFYPAAEKIAKLHKLVAEAREEQKRLKTLVREITELPRESERWDPKVSLLMENFEHLVKEEERMILPRLRRYHDYQELEQLGTEFMAAKKKERSAAAA